MHGPVSDGREILREQKLMQPSWTIGLDLGQAHDYTALSVMRGTRSAPAEKPTYEVGHLERFPLGCPYPRMVDAVMEMTRRPELADGYDLVVDATGVGRPVVDLLRDALGSERRRLHPVTITGGGSAGAGVFGATVPKRDLVMALKVLLESERLRFAAGLPDTAVLIRETLAFRVKITASANDTYGAWREGEHDDLVLSVALAAWYAERMARRGVARSRVG